MCGIAGFLHARVDENAGRILVRMADALAHRGPDGRGFFLHDASARELSRYPGDGVWGGEGVRTSAWVAPPLRSGLQVGLASRRLAIVDRLGGDQPLFNKQRDVVVVFNGEIYNYRDLRAELLRRGYPLRTQTDTEVIAHLYDDRGLEGMLDVLEGMFAFALWDERRGSLYLVRDRVGEKPLYVVQGWWGMAFASELRGLLRHPRVERRIDLEALGQYLLAEGVPSPKSIYEGMIKVCPGTWMEFRGGEVREQRYWKPPGGDGERGGSYYGRNDERALVEGVELTIEKAVEGCLIGEVPLGVLLSGGLDSGLVAALASKRVSNLHTFSMGFDEPSFDESAGARAVAAHLGTSHHAFRLRRHEIVSLFDRAMEAMDEPLADASFLPTLALARKVREYGFSVVLTGDGGDEVFGGYPTYRLQRLGAFLERCPPLLSALARRLGEYLPSSYNDISLDFALRRIMAGLSRPSDEMHALWMSGLLPSDLDAVVTPAYRSRILAGVLDPVHVLRPFMRGMDRLSSARLQDLMRYLPDCVLVKMDRATMVSSLEARAPLLNHHVVELGFSLPNRWIASPRQTKILLRKIAGTYLPPAIVRLPKKGFGMPTAQWLRGLPSELVLGWLTPAHDQPRFFRLDVLEQWLAEHNAGRRDHRKRLWPIMVFERWRKGRFGPAGGLSSESES